MFTRNHYPCISRRRNRRDGRGYPSRSEIGEETRCELKGQVRRTEEEIIEKSKEARAALDEVIERGKNFVDERREDVEAAVRAGREAVKEKMEKCCS